MDKTADPTSISEPGGSVTYTYTVTNTSPDEDVTIDSLEDDVLGPLAGDGDCQVGTVLARGRRDNLRVSDRRAQGSAPCRGADFRSPGSSARGMLVGMADVTRILDDAAAGDPKAAAELLPLVYDELRKLAARRLAREKPGQTLQATALVHEAYLRLVGPARQHPQRRPPHDPQLRPATR